MAKNEGNITLMQKKMLELTFVITFSILQKDVSIQNLFAGNLVVVFRQ